MDRLPLRQAAIRLVVRAILGAGFVCANQLAAQDVQSASNGDAFRQHVVPIFQRRCLKCHNSKDRKGDFSLETADAAFAAGHIEAGDSRASHLIDVLTPVDGKAEMPKNAGPLPRHEIAVIRKWIDQGARWPADFELTTAEIPDLNWWSLRPLKRPVVPAETSDRVRTPVDAFALAAQRKKGLSPTRDADRLTLARRLFFDLIGLPPAPQELAAFIHDRHPQAYERLVDRLLQSHHYGERWTRHWGPNAELRTHGFVCESDKCLI